MKLLNAQHSSHRPPNTQEEQADLKVGGHIQKMYQKISKSDEMYVIMKKTGTRKPKISTNYNQANTLQNTV